MFIIIYFIIFSNYSVLAQLGFSLAWLELGWAVTIIKCSFYRSLLNFMEDTTVQTNLRALVARILSLEMQKHKVENDVETDPKLRAEVVLELHANLQSQYTLLPKMEDLINTHFSGKYMKLLNFLLHKASEVTRTFNKKKSGNRAREQVNLLHELNCYSPT